MSSKRAEATKFEWLGLSHAAFRLAVIILRPRPLIRLVSAPGHDDARLETVQVVVSSSRLKQSNHTLLTATFLGLNLWV